MPLPAVPTMDFEDPPSDHGEQKPSRELPKDLPMSLNDRRHAPLDSFVSETEMYDGWQGALRHMRIAEKSFEEDHG